MQPESLDAERLLRARVARTARLGDVGKDARLALDARLRHDEIPRTAEQGERIVKALALRILEVPHQADPLVVVQVFPPDAARLADPPRAQQRELHDGPHWYARLLVLGL